MYITRDRYKLCTNDVNAMKWHEFQDNILEYFNVNDKYEL